MIVSGLTTSAKPRDGSDRQLPLLLVGRDGFIPDCNIVAIRHEFPQLSVHPAANLADRLGAHGQPSAILLHETYVTETTESELAYIEAHSDCVVAVVVENAKKISGPVEQLIASGLVRGVLPMNLRLEIWLLALRLLLRGGEFVPISLARPKPRRADDRIVAFSTPDIPKPSIAALTERELQVLQMLSTGCPNRVIASRFSLSEHTVKVHVHNIIRKLSASNRTAAAAMYLESLSSLTPDIGSPGLAGVAGQV